jgi:hypothetical protein
MQNIDLIVILLISFLFICLILIIYPANKIKKWKIRRRIRVLQKTLPDNIFTIVVSPPFVFVSDEETADLSTLVDHTIKWIVPKLKATYFRKSPRTDTVIWILKNRESYESYVQKYGIPKNLLKAGYFSPQKNEIVIDAYHWYGELLHEIIHAFMASNFPQCPAWFNEGLATLYSTCKEEGDILGLPDWRLYDIQSAILTQTVLSFKEFCALEKKDFYQFDEERNYAQAQYLCYYLQQHGLLNEFYQIFQRNLSTDPTGYKTLQTVVRYKDMQEFQEDWKRFILTIPCPSETTW